MTVMGRYSVETPEAIELSFELAGPGSRFCALVIDLILSWLVIFVVALIVAFAGFPIWSVLEDAADVAAWALAVIIVATSVIFFGYFLFFELIMRGQTPGKRHMELRVLRDDATAAQPMDLVIRNLIRVVDALPGLYVVGGIASLLSSKHQRLGDLAAGTIVVKESALDYGARSDKRAASDTPAEVVTNRALSTEERRLIRGFLERRAELLPQARAEVAARLATRLRARHGGTAASDEVYLEQLATGDLIHER